MYYLINKLQKIEYENIVTIKKLKWNTSLYYNIRTSGIKDKNNNSIAIFLYNYKKNFISYVEIYEIQIEVILLLFFYIEYLIYFQIIKPVIRVTRVNYEYARLFILYSKKAEITGFRNFFFFFLLFWGKFIVHISHSKMISGKIFNSNFCRKLIKETIFV